MKGYLIRMIVAIISMGVVTLEKAIAADANEFQFLNATREFPTSFDPLESDWGGNQDLARMIYLTPIELSSDDRLTSTLLEKYDFDSKTNEIHFFVRNGLTFTNGAPITSDDLAFSIARVAYSLDNFPIISDLLGLDSWKKQKTALSSFPKGIVVKDNLVTLKLAKAPRHPLFRFLAPQFSIIPRSSVDIEKNALKVSQPPSSGFYRVLSMKKPSLELELRTDIQRPQAKMPERIVLKFVSAEELENVLLSGLPDHSVAMTKNNRHAPKNYLNIKEKTEFRSLQSTDISLLVLNPSSEIFRTPACRSAFSHEYRKRLLSSEAGNFGVEGSLFTKVLPGYLELRDLETRANTNKSKHDKCIEHFKGAKVTWFKHQKSGNNMISTLEETFASLGFKATGVSEVEGGVLKAFTENRIDAVFLSTGFWATDTAGDLKMLFTPGLWYPGFLDNLTHDQGIKKLVENLEIEENGAKRKVLFEELNRHVFEDATINVYQHPKLFFIYSKNNRFMPPPVGMMEPAPWQLFQL